MALKSKISVIKMFTIDVFASQHLDTYKIVCTLKTAKLKKEKLRMNNKNFDFYRGTQFYWSQKEPLIANLIYSEFCKKNDIIWDPFLGAGSSLYGIRKSQYSFVGTEINEFPNSIVKFNIKKIDQKRLLKIKQEFDSLLLEIGNPYIFNIENDFKVEIEKVIFDMNENHDPIVKEIKLTKDSFGKFDFNSCAKKYKELWIENKKNSKSKQNDLKLVKNSRLAIKENMWLSDIFSPTNFVYLNKIKSSNMSSDLKFVISSALHLCRLTDLKAQSQFPYWVPQKNIVDRNIILIIKKRINDLKKMINIGQINEVSNFSQLTLTDKPNCLVFNKPIQNINDNDIPNNTIDFVITDPPYFDQVAYSEYSIIWEYFLGFKSNIKQEIVVSQRIDTNKTEQIYLNEIKKSFKIIYNKMKTKAKMALYFKDSRIDKTIKFLYLLKSIGFELLEQRYISKKKYTYKQNNSSKTSLDGESVFILIKSNSDRTIPKLLNQNEYKNIIIDFAKDIYIKQGAFSINQLLSCGLMIVLLKYENSQSLKSITDLINIIEDKFYYSNNTRKYSLNNE